MSNPTTIQHTPIDGSRLVSEFGFTEDVSLDKDFDTDTDYSLKYFTYSKPVIGDLVIEVTEEQSFDKKLRGWVQGSTYVELKIGHEYQKLEINSMASLVDLIKQLTASSKLN